MKNPDNMKKTDNTKNPDNTKNGSKKRIKGELTAKIVWLIAAIGLGFIMITNFLAIGSPDEDTMDCIKEGIKSLTTFLAFAVGVFYLFNGKRKKAGSLAAVLYAAAYAVRLILELTGGSSYAVGDLTTMVLTLLAYAVFAAFAVILMKGQPQAHPQEQSEGIYEKCLKFWYGPVLLLFLIGMAGNLWTELVRPAGFLWDGLLLDTAVLLILCLPICTMCRVMKERTAGI